MRFLRYTDGMNLLSEIVKEKKIHSSFAVSTLNYNHCIVYDNCWVKMEMALNLCDILREQERPDSYNFH